MTNFDYPNSDFDPSKLPDFDTEFIDQSDIEAFAKALNAPASTTIVALNDWRPVHQRVKRKKPRSRRQVKRTTDETREGFVYNILKWPFFLIVSGWIWFLGLSYLITRLYIWSYERSITWRGRRETLRQTLHSKTSFAEW